MASLPQGKQEDRKASSQPPTRRSNLLSRSVNKTVSMTRSYLTGPRRFLMRSFHFKQMNRWANFIPHQNYSSIRSLKWGCKSCGLRIHSWEIIARSQKEMRVEVPSPSFHHAGNHFHICFHNCACSSNVRGRGYLHVDRVCRQY